MKDPDHPPVTSEVTAAGDAEALRHLQQAIACGKHWYVALLEAVGLWTSAEEVYDERSYHYLIDGEAFDWMVLAERLCASVDGLLPEEEKNALLFQGRPPVALSAAQVRDLIGSSKYRQYLNFFYGVTVEGALLLAVQEEIDKERRVMGYSSRLETGDEAYQRIYGASRDELIKVFRNEKGHHRLKSMTLTELKSFTYWLFKYRLKHSEKARVASDTKKALDYLKRQWARRGFFGALVLDELVPQD